MLESGRIRNGWLASSLLGSCLMLAGCAPQLFSYAPETAHEPYGRDYDVEAWEGTVDPSVLKAGQTAELDLALPSGEKLELVLDPIDPEDLGLPKDQHVWVGSVEGTSQQAIVMEFDGWVEGTIPYNGQMYRLHTTSGADAEGSHSAILEVHAQPVAEAVCAAEPHGRIVAQSTHPGCAQVAPNPTCETVKNRIDVAVLYTARAACRATGAPSAECNAPDVSTLDPTAMENEIYKAIGDANYANWLSGVAHRYELAYLGPASWEQVDEGDHFAVFNAMLPSLEPGTGGASGAGGSSGVGGSEVPSVPLPTVCYTDYGGLSDRVLSVRTAVGADLVTVVYEPNAADPGEGICGWGDDFEKNESDEVRRLSFRSVAERRCLAYFIVAHELAHNFDALHNRDAYSDPADDKSKYHPAFNFGHIEPDASEPWLTIMSYESTCEGCDWIPNYSNPAVLHPPSGAGGAAPGLPTGLADPEENNVAVLNCNATAVSHYECSTPDGPANVFMRDSWADRSGGTICADEPPWRSPWIWVRNDQDEETTGDSSALRFRHEHDHQSAIDGQSNYVYVKIENGGGTNSDPGALEVYFAEASTNLNSHASWEPISALSSVTIDAGRVEVAEFEWKDADIDPSKEYCLLAWWNEKGAAFQDLDLSNLTETVLNDDHLILRNLNPIDLPAPDPGVVTSAFDVKPVPGSPATSLEITVTPVGAPDPSMSDWGDAVNMAVRIPPEGNVIRGDFEINGDAISLGKDDELLIDLGNAPSNASRVGPFYPKSTGTLVDIGFEQRPDLLDIQNDLKRDVALDVTIIQRNRAGKVVGGVSYTLRLPASRP